MKSIRKHTMGSIVGILTAFVFSAFTLSACDDSDSDSSKNAVAWDETKTVYPDKSGAAVMLVTGTDGTPWTAEIVSGGNWISFNNKKPADQDGGQSRLEGTVGSTLSDKTQYVYYWANNTPEERHALIRFTFEGQLPVELSLTQFSVSGDGDVYFTGRNTTWPEIPAQKVNDNFTYVTHFAEMGTGTAKYNARNYTLCMDKTKFASWWVAYPLHASHTGSGRVETWAYDPKISSSFQANLSKSYTTSDLDRGHQIPNADRNGNDAMMAQTFYYSNMTPQNSQLNQQPWQRLEAKARGWICSDTLYVVTGAYWNPNNTATTTDRDGKVIPVPDYYFKVFVRTVAGNIRQKGDALGGYSASQLESIGFWVKNAAGQGEANTWIKSVKEVEDLTGFDFFPTIDPTVKTQKNPSAWGY